MRLGCETVRFRDRRARLQRQTSSDNFLLFSESCLAKPETNRRAWAGSAVLVLQQGIPLQKMITEGSFFTNALPPKLMQVVDSKWKCKWLGVECDMHYTRRALSGLSAEIQSFQVMPGSSCNDNSRLHDEVSEMRQYGDEAEACRPVQVRQLRLEALESRNVAPETQKLKAKRRKVTGR